MLTAVLTAYFGASVTAVLLIAAFRDHAASRARRLGLPTYADPSGWETADQPTD